MALGIAYALAAGLMWGLVFVGPLMLPDYPPALQSVGRYLAFGLIAIGIAWFDRTGLRQLSGADWREAFKLSAVGNLLYYLCLATAIQRAGGPLPTMIIGTLPVMIAVVANWRSGQQQLPWAKLLPSLLLIGGGIACVNQVELVKLSDGRQSAEELERYVSGALFAVGALICWTWYPIRNGDWLRRHANRSPRAWATAQGLATLPLALGGYALLWAIMSWGEGSASDSAAFAMPFGPRPAIFIGLMAAIGLFASWLGTLCWNEASQRLPTALVGQLIVFETLSALAYAFWWKGEWPSRLILLGIALLIAGVIIGVRAIQGQK